MASTVITGTVYGIAVYGTDRYGTSSVTYTPDGVTSSGVIGSVVVFGNALTVIEGVSAVAILGSVVARNITYAVVSGVNGVGVVNDSFTYKLDQILQVSSLELLGVVGGLSIQTSSFDYQSIKDLYERRRVVYVERGTTSNERTVFVTPESRSVYVDSRPNREIVVN
jgi:hypothetical protein